MSICDFLSNWQLTMSSTEAKNKEKEAKMKWNAWNRSVGRPFGILLLCIRNRAISDELLFYCRQQNWSLLSSPPPPPLPQPRRTPNRIFAIHECVYIIHMMFDDTRNMATSHVIFKPFIWWHDVIESHKEPYRRHTYISTWKWKAERMNKKGRRWRRQHKNKQRWNMNYENTTTI